MILPPSLDHAQPQGPAEAGPAAPWDDPEAVSTLSFALVRPDGRLCVATRSQDLGEWRDLTAEGDDLAPALRSILTAGPVITLHRAGLLANLQDVPTGALVVELVELQGLLLATRGSAPQDEEPASADARSVLSRAAAIVAGVRSLPIEQRAVMAHGWLAAWAALRDPAPAAAAALALAVSLLEHAPLWTDKSGAVVALDAGGFAPGWKEIGGLEEALDEAEPRCAEPGDSWKEASILPPDRDGPLPFHEQDRARLERVMETELPACFGPQARPREAQLCVARAVADSLGTGELLLLNAPTGTGKTLAYLVPLLLWAQRHGVRAGIATYTRALQEQAMARELPIALRALASAGHPEAPRVSLLKGRRNYLCWRALRLAAPGPMDPATYRLAWITLTLFAFQDPDGDLDRLPMGMRVPGLDALGLDRELQGLVRQTHSESGCCRLSRDRRTCAAEAAQRRADRAHLVVTNQALALSRQELFRHLVFDECEHLHDVAHATWSYRVGLGELEQLLGRLAHGRRRRSEGPLERALAQAPVGGPLYLAARHALEQHRGGCRALDALRAAVMEFADWRKHALRERVERDAHSLFREYARSEEGSSLCRAHAQLADHLSALSAAMAAVSEDLGSLPTRGLPRLRRSFDVTRSELDEISEGVEAWLPRGDDERPLFRSDRFYDLEEDGPEELRLASRLLLPHETLGRSYYPGLAGAVLLSATTWLRDGFRTARSYLGLQRAAEPAEGEEREPAQVSDLRAPEVFDYGRVLFAVPRDAPPVRDKDAWLEYVARFIAHLSERTEGRVLTLFTNASDCARTGAALSPFFAERGLPLYYQGMRGASKEELGARFREERSSTLLGLDTFWYGADFPGTTLQYLVLARLPYGVPDAFHHAQCAAMGSSEQYSSIYAPRALAKFRQGFGRLMRREEDRGAVFSLDRRLLEPRHRVFLRELPIERPTQDDELTQLPDTQTGARLVRGDTDHCVRLALEHMGLWEAVAERGLEGSFAETRLQAQRAPERPRGEPHDPEVPF